MISIIAKFSVDVAKVDEFIQTAQALVEGSQAEAGCIAYSLYQDNKDKGTVAFIEHWKDQAAIDSHDTSPHFTSIFPKLQALSNSIEVNFLSKVSK